MLSLVKRPHVPVRLRVLKIDILNLILESLPPARCWKAMTGNRTGKIAHGPRVRMLNAVFCRCYVLELKVQVDCSK